MRAATEGNLAPVMPQGNLVEALGREVRQGSPGELMVESSPSRQRRPPCKTNKEMSDDAADAAALTYLLTYSTNCPALVVAVVGVLLSPPPIHCLLLRTFRSRLCLVHRVSLSRSRQWAAFVAHSRKQMECKWTRSCLSILSRDFCSSKSRWNIFPVSSSTFP